MVKQQAVKNINTLKNATTALKQHTVKIDYLQTMTSDP